MDSQRDLQEESWADLGPLREMEPSPVDSPIELEKEYFPEPKPLARSSALGLSGHSTIFYLTRIQKYSSYAFSAFLAMHITNTSIIPLATRSLPASDTYLLLTRPYYQSAIAEPLIVVLPLILHVSSGVALRLYRRHQLADRYGALSRADRRRLAWPALSGTSALGYALAVAVLAHTFVNRMLPLWVEGGSSGVGLSFVSHGFARHRLLATVAYTALVSLAGSHIVWGWAKWLGWAPAQVTKTGAEGALRRKRRWYGINLVAALVMGLWMAGGLGPVARGGAARGWIGRGYDAIYDKLAMFGL